MNILAFADLHAHKVSMEKLRKKSKEADIIIAAGDMSIFGNHLDTVMGFLISLGKPVLVLHGNHESEEEVIGLVGGSMHFIHNSSFMFAGTLFIGWGGGGFSMVDTAFERNMKAFISQCSHSKKTVFITHQPPYGTKLDKIYGSYVGNKSFRTFIRQAQPTLAISGHIHETARKTDLLGKTFLVNPGPEGMLLKV